MQLAFHEANLPNLEIFLEEKYLQNAFNFEIAATFDFRLYQISGERKQNLITAVGYRTTNFTKFLESTGKKINRCPTVLVT